MSEQTKGQHTFTGVHVYKSNHVYVPAIADELAEEEDHTLVFRWLDRTWAHRPLAFSVASVCSIERPKPLVMALGIPGEINLFTNPGAAGSATEYVDTSDEGPSQLVQLKCIRSIGGHVYVAGLARRVYRRDAENTWTAIDRGTFVPRSERRQAIGFNAIDGTSDESLYAVGYKGEIWFYDGKTWRQQESPTNVALTCVRCASREVTFVAGMAGTLLRGQDRRWEVVDQDVTKQDFWGMTLFAGKLYVANYEGLFVLESDIFSAVDMGLKRKLSTAYLDSNDGVMWSVGQKDMAYTNNGVTWTVVEPPD
jgi:hypothetical protein